MQDWITVTNIRIILSRPAASVSTSVQQLSDDQHQQLDVPLSSSAPYFYSLSDFAVGGRCKCNGHAALCTVSTRDNKRLICDCRHNTVGTDCERCKPFYYDRPWARATLRESNPCVGTFYSVWHDTSLFLLTCETVGLPIIDVKFLLKLGPISLFGIWYQIFH